MVPISIAEYIKYLKNNEGIEPEFEKTLIECVQAKADGAVCGQCGRAIWAIGSATAGHNACFTCITREANDSEDYEIDSVCFP